MKKTLKFLLILLSAVLAAVCLFLGWLTVTEYKPDARESVAVTGSGTRTLSAGDSLTMLSWNIGYAGLGAESDFFMDGGKNVAAADKATVQRYLDGIQETVAAADADLILLQEVDRNSRRSYGINEADALATGSFSFATNFKAFVPYPVPMIGKVDSGLLTCSAADIAHSERIALPCPFSWPIRTANLKRCLLVSTIPLEGSDKNLVVVNLHLEAYDNGEGKIAQTKVLHEFLLNEYEKGNYVIAGGDFNQVFPGTTDLWPIESPELWLPGTLDTHLFPEDWTFAYSSDVPSCRLLNQPYDPAAAGTQHYAIDGYIVSPNVTVDSIETLDLGFTNSDHNPVQLKLTLQS